MGIMLPGIGYDSYVGGRWTNRANLTKTVTDKSVDSWLAWTNPRGPRYCGDGSENDFSRKSANLRAWFHEWAVLNPGKRLAVVTHSWLMKNVLFVCKESNFMSTRAVNAQWEIVDNCVG